VNAWNKGSVSFDVSSNQEAYHAVGKVGLIAPRVWVGRCQVTFDLGHSRVLALGSSSVRDASDASHGLGFFPVTNGSSDGIFAIPQIGLGGKQPPWNACQLPNGTIRLGACPKTS
jgi:hypothetical protein